MIKNLIFILFLSLSISAAAQDFDGYALYNTLNNRTAFLIDKDGDIAYRWNCDDACNYAVLMRENGNLIRGAVKVDNIIRGPAVGGKVQEIDRDGNTVWEYVHSDATKVQHHDISLMPNGGVLITAWDVAENDLLQDMGYEGTTDRYPTRLLEIQPDGNGGGKVVWEWSILDHMIQDVDPNKPNFGVVADNPQLMDINVPSSGRGGPGGGGGDWFHVNGVDYNEELDLITFSSRYMSEIFVIDHSTTTAEAAGHTGGNSGMGGDFLYRWGNPANYKMAGDRRISAAVHDARFIPEDGRFRAGFIQFFNNEGADGQGYVMAIDPPFNGTTYDREPGQPYGPAVEDFAHRLRDNADGQSASDALPNGNTFVNLSRGYMYEVDKDDNLVWQYAEGPAKAFRYGCDYPGIQALLGEDACESPSSTKNYLVEENLQMSPNPSTGLFNITGLSGEHRIENIQITDAMGKVVKVVNNSFDTVDLSDQPNGLFFVKFVFEGGLNQTKVVAKN